MSDPRIVHVDDVEAFESSRPPGHAHKRKLLARAAGGRKLGCSLYEIPPGKHSYPYHYHLANEEAIFVLSGSGTIRLAGKELPIRQGDYVALPVGEAGAHQVINSSSEPLRYLCISTMIEPEIAVYPDSKKLGLFAGSAPGGSEEERTMTTFLPEAAAVDFWEGES